MEDNFSSQSHNSEEEFNFKPEEKSLIAVLPPHLVKKNGRPSIYTKEVGDYICMRIATSVDSLRKIAEEVQIDYTTIRYWQKTIPEFNKAYVIAKQHQADELADEIFVTVSEHLDKNDMAEAQRMKIKVDALKWMASKLLPKVYGDKQVIEHEVTHKHNVDSQQFQEILGTLAQKKGIEIESKNNDDIEEAQYAE